MTYRNRIQTSLHGGRQLLLGSFVARRCRAWLSRFVFAFLLFLGLISTGASGAEQPRLDEVYGKLPLAFEANHGQVDPTVHFLARGRGYALFLTTSEAVLTLPRFNGRYAVTTTIVGASPKARVEGLKELPGKSHYYIGNDPSRWIRNMPTYGKVRYRAIYPGIDLVYYGNGRELEYDFVVAPGADPRRIRLRVEGAERVQIDAQGNLVATVAGSQLVWKTPAIYQKVAGSRKPVSGRFVKRAQDEIGFEVARYDRSKRLVIDPVLRYSTYLGGSTTDSVSAIAVDKAGNAYVTGYTVSADFPATARFGNSTTDFPEVFVTKVNPSGTALLYSVIMDGGPGHNFAGEFGHGIAVDSQGNAWVVGETDTANFPTTVGALKTTPQGGFVNAFVTKLSADGSSLLYSTYFDGFSNEIARAVAVDGSDNAYVTGETISTDDPSTPQNEGIPVTSGAFQSTNASPCCSGYARDAFVAKFSPSGQLVYSTYLGGGGFETGYSIAVDRRGQAYIAGFTSSIDDPSTPQNEDFPVANAFQPDCANCNNGGGFGDAFVTVLNATGTALRYSTYLGGANDAGTETAYAVAVDRSFHAYVVGVTASDNFPTVNALQPTIPGGKPGNWGKGFVTKFTPAGGVVYSTYLGGTTLGTGDPEPCLGVAANGSGNAYVTGKTYSTDFPQVNPIQPGPGGYSDAFVTKINPKGSKILFSTFFGGNWNESAVVALGSGKLYLGGATGSSDLRTTTGAVKSTNPYQAQDGFVAKIRP